MKRCESYFGKKLVLFSGHCVYSVYTTLSAVDYDRPCTVVTLVIVVTWIEQYPPTLISALMFVL